MGEFFLSVVNMSISASWIVLAVLILRLLLKKAPKWINVVLWGIVGLRLVMPFSLESVFSLIPSAETVSPQIMTDKTPQINTGVPVINNAINPVISESFTPAPMDSANPLQIWIPILALIWVIGIVGMLLYTVISFWRVKRKIGTAVLLRDNIYQSENVVSPFVLGIIKPRIYLPFNMNEQDMAQVIAHENAHISRKDHLWKPLGFLVLTLHWFNPLMWLGYVLLCRDIELACDEKVVKNLDNEQKADYSQALLSCSVNRRIIAACPLAFGEVGVKKRVKSVLNYKKPAFWLVVIAIVLSIVAAVCFLTNPASGNKKLLLSVLNNEKSFIDESGKEMYLKDYQFDDSAYIDPEKYVLLDLDGDKKDELVIYDDSNYAYIVFHIFDGKVYGFSFTTREFIELRNDGTFIQSGGAGLNMYAALKFENKGYTINEEAYVDDISGVYRIDGADVSREEAQEYHNDFYNNKKEADWKQYDYTKGRGYELIYNRFIFGQETAFNEYDIAKHIEDYFLDENLKENYCYAYFNMTGDKLPELCIDTDIEMYFFTIKDGELYHWYTETNTYSKLLNNGAFLMENHGAEPEHIFYEYYELDKNAKKKFSYSFAWWDKTTADGIEYYELNGVEVSQKEYNRKTQKYLNIGEDKIAWYSINENIEEAYDLVFDLSNSTYPNLKVLVTFDEEIQMATALTVFDKDTNRKLQTIPLNENDLFTSRMFCAFDVNFDGEKDILISQSSSASAQYLSAFVWDTDTMQYVYAPTFENLANVALDTDRELILSSRSSDRMVSYAISDYDEGLKDFIVRKTLSYYPDDAEENMIYKEEQLKNERMEIVKEFIKPFTNYYEMDKELADYYAKDNDWRLDSSIWENYLVGVEDENYDSTEETDDLYPLLEITDERVITKGNKKIFKDLNITLGFPLDWKCFERHGEDGGAYFFQDAELGDECQLILSVTAKESVPSDVYLNERTQSEYSQYLSEAGYKDAKINSFTKEKVGGYNCTKVVFTYSKENTKYTQIDFGYIVDDVRLCDLTIIYPTNESDTYEDIFESIINSVKFSAVNIQSSDLSDKKLAEIVAKELGVPENANITYEVSEKFFWEASGDYYKNVTFYENGEMVATASVNPQNGELLKNILKYSA